MGSSKPYEKSNNCHSPESSHHDLEKPSQELAGNSTSKRDTSIGQNVDHSSIISGDGNTIVNNYFRASELAQTNLSIQELGKHYLTSINIDAQVIQQINADLEAIKAILESGLLSKSQEDNIEALKESIKNLNSKDINTQILEIHAISQALLDEARKVLEKKSISEGKILLGNPAKKCTEDHVKTLKQLQLDLEEGNELAEWLDDNRKRLAKYWGRKAIAHSSEYQTQISREKIGRFCFSLNQFLERIAHCLRWGRANILDSTDIPLELNSQVYIRALELIRREEKLPSYVSEEAISQLDEYINHLIGTLSSYEC